MFKTLSICCLYIHLCIFLHSFHVENIARDPQVIEVEEAEAEYQEEQQLEFEVADQVADQVPEPDIINSDIQQGKHGSILTMCHTSVESLFIWYVH